MVASQEQLEGLVLRALYDFVQVDSGYLSVEQIAGLLNNEYTEARIGLAVRSLASAKYLRGQHNVYSGSKYEISDAGYKKVESNLIAAAVPIEPAPEIPASDRIVSLDHNSKSFRQVIASTREFREQLLGANDTGDLSPREVQVAAHEVAQIADTLEENDLRPAALWSRAKSTLSWIGREAAAAVVGVAALALLALLAGLLGFSI
jgi:hypothetical protein